MKYYLTQAGREFIEEAKSPEEHGEAVRQSQVKKILTQPDEELAKHFDKWPLPRTVAAAGRHAGRMASTRRVRRQARQSRLRRERGDKK